MQYVKHNSLLAGQAVADIGYPVVIHRRAVYKDPGGRNVLVDDGFAIIPGVLDSHEADVLGREIQD
jgi:hypothetical protein